MSSQIVRITQSDGTIIYLAFCQKWEESERGWGTRPDGYSLHACETELKMFIAEYWQRLPDEVPDEYSRPDGTPFWCAIDEATALKIEQSENGIRSYGRPPEDPGIDGWTARR